MSSATVRISLATREKLRVLADKSGESMNSVLERAIEAYRRQQFLEQANDAYATLRSNPEAWREEHEERSSWETTIGDGVEDD